MDNSIELIFNKYINYPTNIIFNKKKYEIRIGKEIILLDKNNIVKFPNNEFYSCEIKRIETSFVENVFYSKNKITNFTKKNILIEISNVTVELELVNTTERKN